MSKIDDNREYVALAVTDDANKTPTPIITDHVTERIMVDIALVGSLPATASPRIPTDDNYQPVALAVTDDANKTPKPILCDANGLLIVDLVFG